MPFYVERKAIRKVTERLQRRTNGFIPALVCTKLFKRNLFKCYKIEEDDNESTDP